MFYQMHERAGAGTYDISVQIHPPVKAGWFGAVEDEPEKRAVIRSGLSREQAEGFLRATGQGAGA